MSCATSTAGDDGDAFLRWATSHIVPVSARAIDQLAGNARVIALGEAAHGVEEALTYRNQVFQRLVESNGFLGIALETGYAESLRVDEYVSGGQGEAAVVARKFLTSGFGNFQANVELIEWMRQYNRTAPPTKRLRFFGIDLSLGGPMGSSATMAPVECALTTLQRLSSGDAERLRRTLSSGVGPLLAEQREFASADYAAYAAFTHELLEAARQSGDARAVQCATVAEQAGEVQRVSPRPGPGGIPPDAWRTLEARDLAMADNAVWALAQVRPEGKIVVFAHNAHVMSAARQGGHLSGLAQPPRSMGQKLREKLGSELVIVAEAAPGDHPSRDLEEFGDLLRTTGAAPFMLDYRAAPSPVKAWLSQPRHLRANGDSEALVTPSTAFDAVVVQARHSPARSAAPASGRNP
jgi:erythromycin esterase